MDPVRLEIAHRLAILTLSNPERRNVLSRATLGAMKLALERLAADERVRAVILQAEGPVFSAGHDLRELVGAHRQDQAALFALCSDVMESIRKLPQPVIAQVQGIATAAGCQLVAACDLAVASQDATFATPGVKIGLFCSTPAVPLSRAVPVKKAMEMLLTGAPISALEAERIGLVNRVVPADELATATRQLAQQIAAVPREIVASGKLAFYDQLRLDFPAAYERAQRLITEHAQSRDGQEGMRAFLEKRPPGWSDS
jgi:enoyl-CoA hydratase/carnithine racemase